MNDDTLFDATALVAGINLRNRVVMAPMTTWAANDDGTVSDEEEDYYRRRAKDVGLVITGCTHVQANGVGFTGEFAAHDDRFIPSLSRLAHAAKSGGAPEPLFSGSCCGRSTLPFRQTKTRRPRAGGFADVLSP